MPKWASPKQKYCAQNDLDFGLHRGIIPGGFTNFIGMYNGSYDNTYPSIARIADAMAEVLPYAVDANGERITNTPAAVAALYSPNKQMSGVTFIETMAVMALVHPKVHILVWHRGERITPDSITGYTFLENPAITVDSRTGVHTYRVGERTYTDDEVISISLAINPYALTQGYSPSVSAKKWANVDDYIADYKAGFFKNGAKPAGEFIITAPTVEQYNEIVAEMQKNHRGAGANNNVIYTHRPINYDGTAAAAQVEWVPFASADKDATLAPVFEQANKKLDLAFGVPQEIKGYLSNSNYASVEVADYVFSRRVIYPKLVKMWSQWTHELNRITGGLGYAFSFDYEPPVLVETRKAQLDTLLTALNAGFSLETAVAALQLPKSFLELAQTEQTPDATEVIPVNTEADQSETVQQKSVKAKALEDGDEIAKVASDAMQEQIDDAKEGKEVDIKEYAKNFAKKLLPAILTLVLASGEKQNAAGKQQLATEAGVDPETLPEYEVTEDLRSSYLKYLDDVALSYSEDTNRAIKDILEQGETEGWTYEEIRSNLDGLMDTNYWRVERLTRTERHRAEQYGSWDAMKALAAESGVEIVKIWHINPASVNVCEDCKALDGKRLPIDEDFGEFPVGANEVADRHPQCLCYLTYEIVEKEKIVKVKCPNCKRHLFESSGGKVYGTRCQGCKKHFNFTIEKGVVKAEEATND